MYGRKSKILDATFYSDDANGARFYAYNKIQIKNAFC